ncbi:hypothetical protein QE394_001775 [Arthrobacter sp. SORGH_AS 212]|uniref:hypothetical protein n=1 Tax=Pseudarthrobacter sp. SORGH_AS 212 TaxID=3041777 RepID=UPI00277FA968|nr:hypothetical protein [Arthrobacter sp. SORGH_AS_0212]
MQIAKRILAAPVAAAVVLVSAGGAAAAPAEVRKSGYVNEPVNDCNGEVVFVEGTFQEVIQFKPDGTMIGNATIKGTGIGSQGNHYIYKENGQTVFNADGTAVAHVIVRLISKGPAPDSRASFRLTVFPDGTFVLTTDASCPA